MKKKSKKKTTRSQENLLINSDDESNFKCDNNTLTAVEVYSTEQNKTEETISISVMQKCDESPRWFGNNIANSAAKTTNKPSEQNAIENIDNLDSASCSSQISNATYDATPFYSRNSLPQDRNLSGGEENENIELLQFVNEKRANKLQKEQKKYKKHKLNEYNSDDSSDNKNMSTNQNELLQYVNKNGDDTKQNFEKNIDSNTVENEILTVHIIKTDRLQLHSYVLSTFVRMHLIDKETNEYVKKSDAQKCVNVHNSEINLHNDYIDCLTSKVFHFINYSNLFPAWNDTIIINDDYLYFQKHHSMMMFFEIVESSAPIEQDGDSKMARIVAWAFLMPQHNYEQNLRLQLFYPQNLSKSKCNSYNWWKKKEMRKYPSTLYVKLSKTSVCHDVLKSWPKHGKTQTKDANEEKTERERMSLYQELPPLPKFDTLCNIPKHKLFEIPVGNDGCLMHRFSNNGNYLAFATCENHVYKIVIYDLSNETELCHLDHHQGLIYDLAWSRDDRQLLSASADSTVAIWDTTIHKLEHVLAHSSYVYCCVYSNDKCVATGNFDQRIRLWSTDSYALVSELKGHKGYVTSICFDKKNNFMYSADSTGCIMRWQKEQNKWISKQTLSTVDFKDVIVNQMFLHRSGKRLIVNSRDGHIRLVDIKTGYVMTTFNKGAKEKSNVKCTITPCNSYLLSGTEAGDVYVWRVDNGKPEHVFSPYHKPIVINCIQFEPKNNLLAVSHFGQSMPIIIYGSESSMKTSTAVPIPTQTQITHTTGYDKLANMEKGTNFRLILEKFDKMITVTKN